MKALGLLLALAAIDAGACADGRFRALLAAAQLDPEKADFGALREAYAATTGFDPLGLDEPDISSVQQELNNGERAAALVALERVMADHAMEVEAHAFAARVCKRLREPAREAYHRAFLSGLLDSMKASGDGTTRPRAYRVYSLREQRLLLDMAGHRRWRAVLEHADGHVYQAVTCFDEQLQRQVIVYFDVSSFARRLPGGG